MNIFVGVIVRAVMFVLGHEDLRIEMNKHIISYGKSSMGLDLTQLVVDVENLITEELEGNA